MRISIVSQKAISMVPNYEIIIPLFEEVMACHVINFVIPYLKRLFNQIQYVNATYA